MIAFQFVWLTSWGGVASWTGYACNFATNAQFAWYVLMITSLILLILYRRFPIAVQCIPALGLIIGCFFLPFSPRWRKYPNRYK